MAQKIIHLFSPGVELTALQSVSPASTPRLKGPLRASQRLLQTALLMPTKGLGRGGRPLPHFPLIAPLRFGEGGSPVCKLLPAACRPLLFLQGFWCPQGHTAPVETIPQGSSPWLFYHLNHAFFCPYLVLIWLLGSHPRASFQGKHSPVLTGALSSPGV